jgi:hypothetical protein
MPISDFLCGKQKKQIAGWNKVIVGVKHSKTIYQPAKILKTILY